MLGTFLGKVLVTILAYELLEVFSLVSRISSYNFINHIVCNIIHKWQQNNFKQSFTCRVKVHLQLLWNESIYI